MKNRNGNKRGRILRTVFLAVVMPVVLAGCGRGSSSYYNNQTESGSPAAGGGSSVEESSAQENDAAKSITSEAEAAVETSNEEPTASADSDSSSEDSSITYQLAEGQQVIGESSAAQIPFEGEAPELAINWNNMTNTAAWLVIPGTDISSGVLTKEKEQHIWLDAHNNATFNDPVTVIHGSYDSGDVLESITAYGDEQFFKEHPYLYIYLPNGQTIEYKVFASYVNSNESILQGHNAYNYQEFCSYIDSIYQEHNMGKVTDSSLHDRVISDWQVLTIDARSTEGDDFILQSTLTGQEMQQ